MLAFHLLSLLSPFLSLRYLGMVGGSFLQLCARHKFAERGRAPQKYRNRVVSPQQMQFFLFDTV
jgi:hypothetical protein